MASLPLISSLSLLLLSNAALAALPLVDFDRMGTVGLAGAFAGLDLFQNNSFTFDSETSTLLSRSSSGSLTTLASTNKGGRISAGCGLDDTFYFAGSFSSIGSTSASNVASYSSSSSSFSALGSNGPNGEVDSIFCDTKNHKVWVGGKFSSPGSSVAVWDTNANSWSEAPFVGVSGAQSRVLSITTNSSASSLFFAGSFITSFGGAVINGSSNPNVTASPGATPYSSSLVPIPLDDAEVDGSPSTSDSQFSNIKNIVCPAGNDGPGNTWFAADSNTAVVTIRKFSFLSASGVRLGNTFLANHGTTGFSVTTIPDNTVRQLKYIDPSTNQNATCTDPCPLLTDPSIPYQDFLFDEPLTITGVQIKLSQFTGTAPGLHIVQLLSSGAFASAVEANNGISCFAPNPSNTSFTGNWVETLVGTNISGTTQRVLTSEVNVGTSSEQGPSFTWKSYVSASGNYEVRMLVPGCTTMQDCGSRTSVQVTVFPGDDLNPTTPIVDQTNTEDAAVLLYSGPIVPSSDGFVMTVNMKLADNPKGTGQDGKYELVADRIELTLTSADVNSTSGGNGGFGSGSASGSGRAAFGFLEWPLDASNIDATKSLSNSSLTGLDIVGIDMFTGLGGTSGASASSTGIASVAHHSSGAIFLGGNFTLSSGPASGSSNVVMFRNGALVSMANNGLGGSVRSLVIDGDSLFVGGSFQDTSSASTNGQLKNIAVYNIGNNQWSALGGGVDGIVTSLGVSDGQVQVVGNFTKVFASSSDTAGLDAPGFATWDINQSRWVNNGGFLVGSMTMVTNGTQSTQFLAGNVVSSRSFGASGMVMLKNSDNDVPDVTPLSFQLEGTSPSSSSGKTRRSFHIPRTSSWMSHVRLSHLFNKRQSNNSPASLPSALPAAAPAVLAGAFWTNSSSSKEIAIIGGNFSFVPAGSSTQASAVALYDQEDATLTALQGAQINGTVRTLFVDDNILYIGGEFTLTDGDSNVNGFAIYDLQNQQWSIDNVQSLQASSGSSVVVRSITQSSAQSNTVNVAGSFAQAGSLTCQAICSLDTQSKQWNSYGSGIQGEIASVAYGGNNQEFLFTAGSINLNDGTLANVAQLSISNKSWSAVGSGSDIPGPVTAVEVNNGNAASIFAAGRSTDGNTFLTFYNGVNWTTLASSSGSTVVSQLAMVPLQNTHDGNNIIESDRMLMVSGALADSQFGNASSALYDGQTFIPYIVASSSTGSSSFTQRHFLATGVVILISIAISAGVVFLLALIGILWTLFSRRDKKDKLGVMDGQDDDDDSIHHRPSSLLEHVNAATRHTIIGGIGGVGVGAAAAAAYDDGDEKEHHDMHDEGQGHDHDPYGPDASNYLRAETPSDAFAHGMGTEEASRPAYARYSFDGGEEGELPLSAGSEVEVLDDRDHAWWYVRDIKTGQEGVVPAAYLY
ncbi:hypothetical protein D9758_011480 [Tetrapyrgos nigripes]|uniref:SH3 domain-containing protein n=1 Tax=Tetrapyrgos nigripes TaxID=182062 RepID=A0A8H5CR19_9AGAR|nr:hypothetical protein D9758_011480 [Tetrapyrgos nigripes]